MSPQTHVLQMMCIHLSTLWNLTSAQSHFKKKRRKDANVWHPTSIIMWRNCPLLQFAKPLIHAETSFIFPSMQASSIKTQTYHNNHLLANIRCKMQCRATESDLHGSICSNSTERDASQECAEATQKHKHKAVPKSSNTYNPVKPSKWVLIGTKRPMQYGPHTKPPHSY
jgi:hypothetical protein